MADEVSSECIICTHHFWEPFHSPITAPCKCKHRVCEECYLRVEHCPSCRAPLSHDHGVDKKFLEAVLLQIKGHTCDGCGQFVRSRHLVRHTQACTPFLYQKCQDTLETVLHCQEEYRDVAEENQRLQDRITDMNYQLNFLSRRVGLGGNRPRIHFVHRPNYLEPPPPSRAPIFSPAPARQAPHAGVSGGEEEGEIAEDPGSDMDTTDDEDRETSLTISALGLAAQPPALHVVVD